MDLVPSPDKHDELINLLNKNNQLLEQNHVLLTKLDKRARNSFWVKVIWYIVLFGLPLLFYSYFIDGIMAMTGLSSGNKTTTGGVESSLQDAQKVLELLQKK